MERFESLETLEQRLIRSLREKRPDESAEVRVMINAWTDEQEKIVDASKDRRMAQIELNLRRARLYFKAGYKEEALENFNDAMDQAYAMRHQDPNLEQRIINEMDSLEI